MDDDLGDQRVVIGRNLGPAFNPVVNAYIRRKYDFGQESGAGLEIFVWIFGVDPDLDGVAPARGGQSFQRGKLAGRKANHPFHQIDAAHRFGDAVFDLKTGVDLQKIKRLRDAIVNKLHGSGRSVVDGLAETYGSFEKLLADSVRKIGRRRLLDDLLVSSLDRAIAFAEGQNLASAVAENLNLNMARHFDKLLEINSALFEIGFSQTLDRFKSFPQLGRGPAELETDPTATRRAFDHDRKSDLLSGLQCVIRVRQKSRARQKRCAGL